MKCKTFVWQNQLKNTHFSLQKPEDNDLSYSELLIFNISKAKSLVLEENYEYVIITYVKLLDMQHAFYLVDSSGYWKK